MKLNILEKKYETNEITFSFNTFYYFNGLFRNVFICFNLILTLFPSNIITGREMKRQNDNVK
jgi:hypothetical protein